MSAAGVTATALVILALAVCAPFAWRFARAWWMPAPSAFVTKDDSKENVARYAAAFDPYVKQLDGRSLFYEPSAPGTEGEVAVEEQPEDNPDAPAPTRYDGPAITAAVLDTVWFSDGQRVKVGEGKKGDLEVVSTNTPWDIRVRWRGTEFTVPFFERDKVIFKDRGPTSSAAKGAVAARPEPSPASDAAPRTKLTESEPDKPGLGATKLVDAKPTDTGSPESKQEGTHAPTQTTPTETPR